jgi:hypothetical protein
MLGWGSHGPPRAKGTNMSFGLVEVITLLLSLSGFSLQQNPKPATPDQALQYAMPDADIVVHVDATSIIGGNYKLLSQLPNQPAIKASPEIAKTVRKVVGEIDGLKGLVKTTTGVDLTTDVSDGTLFVQAPPAGQNKANVLIQVRGKFSIATIDRIGKMLGPPIKVGGGAMLDLPPGQFPFGAVGVTKDGVLLAGASQTVKDRLADTWKMPARATGSNLAHVASVLETKPVATVILTMSPAARKTVVDEFKGQKNFITDVINRHKLAAFSLYTDGIGWTWIDSTKPGLDAMAQISEGAMEMIRAAHIAPRGFAKIALGALESYRGNKQVDELVKRKADLWKIVETYTGDGNFKVAIDKNPATLRLTARATGKSLSDVLPAGLLLPGSMWLLVGTRSASSMPPPTTATPPKLTPAPAPAPPPRPKK